MMKLIIAIKLIYSKIMNDSLNTTLVYTQVHKWQFMIVKCRNWCSPSSVEVENVFSLRFRSAFGSQRMPKYSHRFLIIIELILLMRGTLFQFALWLIIFNELFHVSRTSKLFCQTSRKTKTKHSDNGKL